MRQPGRSLAIVVALLLSGSVPIRAGWSHRFGDPAVNEVATAIAATEGGGALVAGGWNTDTVFDGLIARLDAYGNVTWSLRYGTDFYSTFQDLLALPGGESLAGGWVGGPTAGPRYGSVVRFDALGRVAWARSIVGANYVTVRTLALAPDGGIVAAGRMTAGSSDADFVLELAPDGTIAWQVRFDSSEAHVDSLVVADDGSMLLVGSTASVSVGHLDPWAARLDASHALVWPRAHVHATGGAFYDVVSTPGGWRAVGVAGGNPWMATLGNDGTLLGSSTLLSGRVCYAQGAATDAEGDVAIAGYINSPNRGFVAKRDPNGTEVWTSEQGVVGSGGHAVAIASDGGLLVAGSIGYDAQGGPLDIWAVRVEPDGSAASDCWAAIPHADAAEPAVTFADTSFTLTDPGLTIRPTLSAHVVRDVLPESGICGPGEVLGLRATRLGTDVEFTWSPLVGADSYELYRGNIGSLALGYSHSAFGACGVVTTAFQDPVAGDGRDLYYLVIARAGTSHGPFGTASNGRPIPAPGTFCP